MRLLIRLENWLTFVAIAGVAAVVALASLVMVVVAFVGTGKEFPRPVGIFAAAVGVPRCASRSACS